MPFVVKGHVDDLMPTATAETAKERSQKQSSGMLRRGLVPSLSATATAFHYCGIFMDDGVARDC